MEDVINTVYSLQRKRVAGEALTEKEIDFLFKKLISYDELLAKLWVLEPMDSYNEKVIYNARIDGKI